MELSGSLGNLGKILSGLLNFEDQRLLIQFAQDQQVWIRVFLLPKLVQRSVKKGKTLLSPRHFCPMWRDSQEIWRSEALRGTDWHHYILALLTRWNYLGAATSQDTHLSQSEVCLKEHRSLCGTLPHGTLWNSSRCDPHSCKSIFCFHYTFY